MADTETYEIHFGKHDKAADGKDTMIRVACTLDQAMGIMEEIEDAGFEVGRMERRDAMSMQDWVEKRHTIFVDAALQAAGVK